METNKLKIALYQNVQYKFYSIWQTRDDGQERDLPDYARVSEWIEVDFPPLPEPEIQASKNREVEAVRARLQKQLAELDAGEAK